MEKPQDSQYCKGYIAGYQAGVRDAVSGKNTPIHENDVASYPIQAMGLSTRAINCLSQTGCTYVSDVAALSDHTISTLRNMGVKTASEIAQWLYAQGILCGAWVKFL